MNSILSRRKKGFTLVELLLAVFILTWAIGGVLLLYASSMISSQLAWDTIVATSHAEHILEEMQTRDSLGDILAVNWGSWAGGQGLNTLPDETIDVSFTDSDTNLLGVGVTVNWIRKSRTRHVDLKTKITK